MPSDTKGLHYYLLSGAANLEPFRIFKSQQIDWHDRTVTFYVLGTSHAVALGQGDRAFTELLSCAPATQTRVLEESGVDAPYLVSRTIGDVIYTCDLRLIDLATENGLGEERADEHMLSHTFDPVERAGEPRLVSSCRAPPIHLPMLLKSNHHV